MVDNNSELKCCNETLEFKLQKGAPWQEYTPETADCTKCDAYFERKPNSEIAYKSVNDGESYSCTKCNGKIEGVRIAHTVRDGLFPFSGSGECKYEGMPYCPNCEEKPSSYGAPIEA